jgi:hypothetical protein
MRARLLEGIISGTLTMPEGKSGGLFAEGKEEAKASWAMRLGQGLAEPWAFWARLGEVLHPDFLLRDSSGELNLS